MLKTPSSDWLSTNKVFDLDLEIFCPRERMKMANELLKERENLQYKVNFLDKIIYEISGK